MHSLVDFEKCSNINILLQFLIIFETISNSAQSATPCDRSRKVYDNVSYGVISDGINSNYTQDSHCEWLIQASNDSQFITLKFLSLKTECSYDYIFVYDGNSYNSKLIGSFSGKTNPHDIVAFSGHMLILLFSDTNYVLDGFKAEFSINNCVNNCSNQGLCLNHTCFCTGDWIGEDCSIKACDCGDLENRGFCNEATCECRNDYSGQSCSLHKYNPEPNVWHWISNSTNSFSKRAAHTAIYNEYVDSVYIFGGYDLNNVLSSLQIYRFNTSKWEDENGNALDNWNENQKEKRFLKNLLLEDTPTKKSQFGVLDQFWFRAALLSHVQSDTEQKSDLTIRSNADQIALAEAPAARYGHAAASMKNGFAIFGGKLSNGSFSNDLWFYDINDKKWSQLATKSIVMPPKLTRHTLTYVNTTNHLYVFGGALENNEFSSKTYRIKLSNDDCGEQWEEFFIKGGKSLDVRMVAHSTIYHHESNSLIVYGGIIVSVARFSKLSDRMFCLSLGDHHWTEIFYPRTPLRELSIPRERAFHSAAIAGNYMIIFGGYSHSHKYNKEEICYDNQMYIYHLGCHIWVNHEALGSNKSNYPKAQGVFAHAAVLRSQNTLLIIGGYQGTVNNDFMAYTLSDIMIMTKNISINEKCSKYKLSTECIANPECGWCSSEALCYGRTVSNCFTNLQTTKCPGICPALNDCHSCLIHGNLSESNKISSVYHKLSLGKCIWCVQNAACHHKGGYGACGESDSIEKIDFQWWGKSGVEIADKRQCTMFDRPAGLLQIKYYHPVNYSMPDYVSLINSTLFEFSTYPSSLLIDQWMNGETVARLFGYLRLAPEPQADEGEQMKLCASHSQVSMKISLENLLDTSKLISNFTADHTHCEIIDAGKLIRSKILIDLQARSRAIGVASFSQHSHQSRIGLQTKNSKAYTFEFLEPYSNGTCNIYSNCLHCLTDNSCGWCELTSSCLSRNLSEVEHCAVMNNWRYLTLQPTQCPNCSNFISCESCVETEICEWLTDEAKCTRKGRSPLAVKTLSQCPKPCHLRDCSSCLNDKGRCVWCESTEKCFSFSIYTSEFQFGICREWIDQQSLLAISAPFDSTNVTTVPDQTCKVCNNFKNCSICLRSLSCGWCYFESSPIDGICIRGDFNGSTIDCNIALNTDEEALYNYDSCPDVDECGLGIHNCHLNAKCSNTHGSYVCQCKKGYIGDGKVNCGKTCNETCFHGRCSNFPDYECICDIGWSGSDCSVNCGCNNHSTCIYGIGKCDECQDYTEGKYCENCKVGSYGNATLNGCTPCMCNSHGDEKQGYCHPITGQCFCLDNTEGMNCESCMQNYYGDPKNGNHCFLQCQSRAMLQNTGIQGIGSYKSLDGTKECLWILKLSDEIANGSLIHLEIDERNMSISCGRNAIYVFNGLPEFSSDSQSQKQLTSVICKENMFPKIIEESKTGQMTIYLRRSGTQEGFNAILSILSCKLGTCEYPYVCNYHNQCACHNGWTGIKCETEICPSICSFNGTCDISNNQCICNEGLTGKDCSKVIKSNSMNIVELFTTQIVSNKFEHLKKTLPRFGHSAVVDRRGFLWIFGGYSLAHGTLNDIRQFDTKNRTWMQVTIDGSDSKMPVGRYFHASEITKQKIYTYGGLHFDNKLKSVDILEDFWEFHILEQKWAEVEIRSENPGPLAGHAMTLIKHSDKEFLVIIGGLTNEAMNGSYGMWQYDFNKKWIKLNVSGDMPVGIFGHTAVYRPQNQIIYIFGGYQFINGQYEIANKMYAFNYEKLTISELPVFSEINRPEDNIPRLRALHSAVSFPQFMVVYGGETSPYNLSDVLNVYVYNCNYWIKLTENVETIGNILKPNYLQAMAADHDSDSFFIVGGLDSTFTITKVQVPSDICSLWSSSKYLCRLNRGCSFGTVLSTSNDARKTFCFSTDQKDNRKEQVSSSYNWGAMCDDISLAERNCSSFTSCSACQATWPSETSSPCQWCQGDSCDGLRKCRRMSSISCLKNNTCTNQTATTVKPCKEFNCSASRCDACLLQEGCGWAEQFDRFQCLSNKVIEKQSLMLKQACPERCELKINCNDCLHSWNETTEKCVWSTRLNKCLSSTYQSLICTGGACGLLLNDNELVQCPVTCEYHKQCRDCLQNAHCGWCSTNAEGSGDGICIEGNLERPFRSENIPGNICNAKYKTLKNVTDLETLEFNWNFLKCPPENECSNSHHSCDRKTEKCVDLLEGYKCQCAEGYKASPITSECLPVCPLGCVRGDCIDPGICKCDFGYVGNNCSIQCLCSGHSNCAGPDRLDECLDCKNNTIGKQCEKCDKFFVGDPKNNIACKSCLQYCNGHTDICAGEFGDVMRNASRIELESFLTTEGPKANAICLNCANQTDGKRCETCMKGYFRGTSNLNDACRHCQCNGHGDICDPVTGEKCDCANNTESDNTCSAKLVKNSIYLCWMSQCSRCKESFSGHPKNGHQCYKHVTIDTKMCLDAKTIDDCKTMPSPLKAGQTVFFVVQPRFMNVDIRIILDVTQGELDFFMSSNDDSFVVLTNQSSGFHEVYLDSKYQWIQEIDSEFDYSENLNITPLVTASKKTFDNSSVPHGFTDDRNGQPLDCRSSGKFSVQDKATNSLITYVTLNQCNALLRVFGLKNRLVITLPQNIHNLSGTRFFVALRAANHATVTYGLMFFRQDQLHIDLFVFFSVFFSCFFLFLAACVVLWKAKQASDLRRARRRHVVEMLNMAQRPYSTVLLDATNEFQSESPDSQNRKRLHKNKTANVKQEHNYVPVAIETTSDNQAAICTVFVRLPGEKRNPVWLGSSLIVQPRNNIFLNKPPSRNSQLHPL